MSETVKGHVRGLAERAGAAIGALAERGSAALAEGTPLGRPGIQPRAWRPEPTPGLTGPYATNHRLQVARRIPLPGHGPEDVVVADDGTVYTGVEDGRILRVRVDGTVERVARVAGRPLGIELLGDDLLVCAETAGLLQVSPTTGRVRPLVGEYAGIAFKFANNAAVHPTTGDVYFTDSSQRFAFEHFMSDLFEASHTGRLFRYSLDDHDVELLADGLAFANGVALAPDGTHLLFAETAAYRISRYWLDGPRAGTVEPLLPNLPGFPDNLTTGTDGVFWLAMVQERDTTLDALMDRPAARHAVYLLPEAVKPSVEPFGWVLGIDGDGQVVHNLMDPTGGAFRNVTGVREHDGRLWLGSLEEDAVAHLPTPAR